MVDRRVVAVSSRRLVDVAGTRVARPSLETTHVESDGELFGVDKFSPFSAAIHDVIRLLYDATEDLLRVWS